MRKQTKISSALSEEELKEPVTDTDSYSSRTSLLLPQVDSSKPRYSKKRIGPYSYYSADVIGCGFSSIVYRGILHDNKDKLVALKVVKLSNLKNHRLLQNEIKLLKKVKHPNIVKLLDVYYTPNNCYIVTEFCEGGSLQNLIQTNASLDLGLIVKDIGSACQHLASIKIMHRDIKPANILLKRGTWKLIDFGFAYELPDLNTIIKEEYIIGSPLFMPLQSLTNHWYSSKCDSFAIGVFIFYLFTGHYPWKGKDKTQLIHQLTQFSPDQYYLNQFPPKIKSYLLPLLHPKISQRMSLIECDFQMFTHFKAVKNIKNQLAKLQNCYTQQLHLCQYVHYLMINIDRYDGIHHNLISLMGRHLGQLVAQFQWDKQESMLKIKENYAIPKESRPFQSDDWHRLNNCLKNTIQTISRRQQQNYQVLLEKLLYYQQIIDGLLYQKKENIIDLIKKLTLNSNFDWLRPNPENIAQMLGNVDFYEL